MKIHTLLSSTAAAALALASGAAHAQVTTPKPSDSGQIEEIVITAQKRAENIQSVPLSVQAVTGDALTAAGVRGPTDLQKLVPSLTIHPDFISAGIAVRIRGFGSPANSATDSDVASYLDGAFISQPGSLLGSFLDVKNIEVLSGPQGMLFGRNAAMGAVSINTNAPSMTARSFNFTAEGGSYGTYSGTGVANLPLTDQLAARVAIKESHTDGVFHNDLDGKTYGENDTFVGRGSTKWDVTGAVTWTMRVEGAVTRGDGVNPLTVYANTASASQLAAFNNFVGGLGFLSHSGGTPPVESNTPSYNFNQAIASPLSPLLRDSEYGVNSLVEWTLTPKLTARLIDTYRDWRNDQRSADSIGTSVSLIQVQENNQSRSTSHELQLISSKDAYLDGKMGFTAGVYYFHELLNLNTSFNFGPGFCPLVGFFSPTLSGLCQLAPQTNAELTAFNQTTDSYAVYGQVNYELLPKVELDLGARETWDHKTANLATVVNNPGIAQIATSEGPEGFTFTDSKPSFRASLSWHVTDRIMPFVTYSTGYKSGGFNSGPSAVPNSGPLRPFASETVNDWEVGVKSTFLSGKALLDVTAFNTDLNNFQDRQFTGTQFLVRNAGQVRSRGVDMQGRYRATPNLTFNFATTYLDAYYVKDTAAPGLEGCPTFPSPAVAGCPAKQDLSGAPLDFAPRWQGGGGVDWKIGTIGGFATSFNASENYTTSFLTANTDNPQSRLPGYYTTDLRFSITPPDARWQLDIFGSNVLDQHYLVSTVAQVLGANIPGVGVSGPGASPFSGATIFRGILGDPQRFGARISGKF